MLDVKGKYSGLVVSGKDLLGVKGWFRYDIINKDIIGVKIIKVETNGQTLFGLYASTMTGAIVAGVGGAIAMALLNRKPVTLDCDVFLRDGSELQIRTDKKNLIKILIDYMDVKGGRRW
jgi:hypothetical protein